MKDIIFVIPAYKPGSALSVVVKRLKELGALNVLIIDDGTAQNDSEVIRDIEQSKLAVVVRHKENLGKVRLLKQRSGMCWIIFRMLTAS